MVKRVGRCFTGSWIRPPSVSRARRRASGSNGQEPTYVEYFLRLCTTRVGVLLAEGDELLGQPLGFFGFGPGRPDGLVGDEGGDEVAEEGLAVGGRAVQVPVFQGTARH